ncbi:ABC transporter permease [Streptomyces sp. 8N616]|uniref:ABC transporter permease n=1 Tax=Streptomyces sp. 8N616 TaxID=3457414 RepID=UPI003FD2BDA8
MSPRTSAAVRPEVTAVIRSEWTKIRSVRSLLASLAGILAGTVGVTVVVCALYGEAESDGPDFEPVLSSFYGLNFGQIAALCFGVLTLAGEYGTGTVRTSLTAVPRRGLFYGAKLAVAGGLALAVGLLTGFCSFLGGQALLGEHGVGLGAPGALRAAVGCGAYLALLTLLSAGVAALLRSAVGALGLLTPVVFLISPILGEISATRDIAQFLPDHAGWQVMHPVPEGPLGAWAGLAVMAGWTAAAVWAGRRALERRDA